MNAILKTYWTKDPQIFKSASHLDLHSGLMASYILAVKGLLFAFDASAGRSTAFNPCRVYFLPSVFL
jgi:hypothetical protein